MPFLVFIGSFRLENKVKMFAEKKMRFFPEPEEEKVDKGVELSIVRIGEAVNAGKTLS